MFRLPVRQRLLKGPGAVKAPVWHCKNARSLDSLALSAIGGDLLQCRRLEGPCIAKETRPS